MKLALAVVVVVAACSHPSAKSPVAVADKPPPGPTCEAVRDHVLTFMPAAEGAPKDRLAQVGELVRVHCTDDNWSVEVRQCLLDATSDTARRCEDLLTQAQKETIEKALAKNKSHDFDSDTIESHDPKPDSGGGGNTGARRAPDLDPSGKPRHQTPHSPPPPPSPARNKPAGDKRDSGDPCEGGQ